MGRHADLNSHDGCGRVGDRSRGRLVLCGASRRGAARLNELRGHHFRIDARRLGLLPEPACRREYRNTDQNHEAESPSRFGHSRALHVHRRGSCQPASGDGIPRRGKRGKEQFKISRRVLA
ncbi:hypothetical protein FRUB_06020 [Fimbriiglobus ruber]|uniref:Uncharacterized protein n=1 Tax=Fimbriiglobus ruber TaxID=1908690 RepID=A0A225DTL2_9BACT|nr:hypothetical protein FRUB_06020 [Fimbriiglobus ruber]